MTNLLKIRHDWKNYRIRKSNYFKRQEDLIIVNKEKDREKKKNMIGLTLFWN